MNRIFVDTWAWYALADTSDRDHIIAQLANEELLEQKDTFLLWTGPLRNFDTIPIAD